MAAIFDCFSVCWVVEDTLMSVGSVLGCPNWLHNPFIRWREQLLLQIWRFRVMILQKDKFCDAENQFLELFLSISSSANFWVSLSIFCTRNCCRVQQQEQPWMYWGWPSMNNLETVWISRNFLSIFDNIFSLIKICSQWKNNLIFCAVIFH